MSQPQPLRIVHLHRLKVAYPPKDFFVAESQEIFDLWAEEMANNPLGDPRYHNGEPYPTHLLDKSKLQFEVGPDDNIIFVDYDKPEEVIGFVYHGLLNDPALLKVLNGTVVDHLNKVRKTLRDNDPGVLAGVGYTSGSRDARSLAWTNNLSPNTTAEQKREHAYKLSALFAHLWSEAKKVMPKVILDDFEEAIIELDGLRMDGGVRSEKDEKNVKVLRYTIVVGDEERSFETSALAPPGALMGINYGRHIHNEKNINKYCLKYITHRTHGQEYGSGFFMADYGIYMPSREDQLAGWTDQGLHGTGHAKNKPLDDDPDFKQIGIAFVLASGIKTELETEKNLGTMIIPKDFDPKKHGMVTSTILNDVEVQPRKRPSMIKRKVKPKTIYAREYKDVFEFPPNHAYSGKEWTKKKLMEECLRRQRAGTLTGFAKTWPVDKFKATLLQNDGVEVTVTKILRKQPQATEVVDQQADVGFDDQEVVEDEGGYEGEETEEEEEEEYEGDEE